MTSLFSQIENEQVSVRVDSFLLKNEEKKFKYFRSDMEPEPDPDPLFHETDPRISIQIKMK